MISEDKRQQNVELALATATKLVLKHGIEGTTKEMIARESGLSRKSIDRYFADKAKYMLSIARCMSENVWDVINAKYSDEVLESGEFSGAALLEKYMNDIKGVLMRETNVFMIYMEFQIYLSRHSENFKRDYDELIDTIGCLKLTEKIFALGISDESIHTQFGAEQESDYFCRTYFGFLSNLAVAYGGQAKNALSQVDRFISQTMHRYWCG